MEPTYWEDPFYPPGSLTLTFYEVSYGEEATVYYLSSNGTLLANDGITLDYYNQAELYSYAYVGAGTTEVVVVSPAYEEGYFTHGSFNTPCTIQWWETTYNCH